MFRLRLFGRPALLRGSSEIRLSPLQLALLSLVYGWPEPLAREQALVLLWRQGEEATLRQRWSASDPLGQIGLL